MKALDQLPRHDLRFSEVAELADVEPTNLRNWLRRNKITLFSEEPASGWRTFSMVDAIALAMMKPLVGYGIDVNDANRIAMAIVAIGHPAMNNLMRTVGDELQFNDDIGVFICRKDDEWKFFAFSFEHDRPWGVCPHPIILNLGVIWGKVFQRSLKVFADRLAAFENA